MRYRSFIVFALLLLIVWHPTFAHAIDYDRWMIHYYEDPHSEFFTEAMNYFQKEGLFSDEKRLYPITTFAACLIKANDALADICAQLLKTFPKKDHHFILITLWWTETQKSKEVIKEYLVQNPDQTEFCTNLLKSVPPHLFENRIYSPESLDARWGSFFATGEEKYVRPILLLASSSEKLNAVDLTRFSAQWSLKSICRDHKKVCEIKDSFYKTASKEQKKILDELFQEKK